MKKSFIRNLIMALVIGIPSLTLTAILVKPVWSAVSTIVYGTTAARVATPIPINVIYSQIVATTVSSVASSTLIPANPSRKVLLIQNQSTLYTLCTDNYSPVSCTAAVQIPPGQNMFLANGSADPGAWYGIMSGGSATVIAKDAQ
jgi:hypothetical protein